MLVQDVGESFKGVKFQGVDLLNVFIMRFVDLTLGNIFYVFFILAFMKIVEEQADSKDRKERSDFLKT